MNDPNVSAGAGQNCRKLPAKLKVGYGAKLAPALQRKLLPPVPASEQANLMILEAGQPPLTDFGNVPIPVIGNGMQSALNQTFAIAISNIRHTAHHAATHTY